MQEITAKSVSDAAPFAKFDIESAANWHNLVMAFYDWSTGEAARSAAFRAEVDALRALAAGHGRSSYPRSTGPLTRHSLRGLERLLDENRALDASERGGWTNAELPTDDGLRHVRDYLRGCRRVALDYLGSTQLAAQLHDLVRDVGYEVKVSTGAPEPAAPVGHLASSMAAHIHRREHWRAGATAMRQVWRRNRPR